MRYVADDGTEFDTEKECLEYEEHINDIKKCFILYGEELNKLADDSSASVYYLHILERPTEVANYLYEEYGIGFNYDVIDAIGIYYYDNDGLWKYVDDLFRYHCAQAEKFQRVKKKLLVLSGKEDL